MAGITTSCSLKPVPCRKTTPYPLTLSSSDSKFFSFRIRDPNFDSLVSLSSTLATTPINSRYGGGGGGSRYSGPDSRRSRQSDSEDEQALDLSTIRLIKFNWFVIIVFLLSEMMKNWNWSVVPWWLIWNRSDSVRLIDEQQNMVSLCVCLYIYFWL